MEYELPTEFDLIVIGTGVIESVVSAAASRIGKRVLHIDKNNYYGGVWASFSLDNIQTVPVKTQISDPNKIPNGLVESEEHTLPVGNVNFDITDFKAQWHIPKHCKEIPAPPAPDNIESDATVPIEAEANIREWSQDSLLKESRKFNIDLTPKLQFARGDFVELLISSNIARYSEYRSVSRVLTWLNGQLETVPCSRSDVFANNKVTVIEKRMLMKLFTSLDVEETDSEHHQKTFKAFLKDKKLTPNLIHYVLYAIAMANDDSPFLQGIQSTRRFLNSLGRFGRTPFLFPMYGSGETTQAFCRLSAVFGGVYALSQPLHGLIFDKQDNFKGLVCGQQRINADCLVIGAENAPERVLSASAKSHISRAIFITDKSMKIDEKEHLTLLLYPPENGKNTCTVIELGSLTGTCPKDLCVVHIIAKQQINPVEDIKHCVENLFNTELHNNGKPNIMWSCYFSIPDTNEVDFESFHQNVHICPGPDMDLDYDNSIKRAKDIFNKIYPDCEFLPRAPDPEEIIIEGEDTENDNIVLEREEKPSDPATEGALLSDNVLE